jgi:hypothetical protein
MSSPVQPSRTVMGCEKGSEMVVREELPLAATSCQEMEEMRRERGVVGRCYCLPKVGRSERRRVVAAICGELPESGRDGGKMWRCDELSRGVRELRK